GSRVVIPVGRAWISTRLARIAARPGGASARAGRAAVSGAAGPAGGPGGGADDGVNGATSYMGIHLVEIKVAKLLLAQSGEVGEFSNRVTVNSSQAINNCRYEAGLFG